ncbi:hypothetical protein [Luteibacter yeojuensis]|uniref:Uncharacterized protein n=1 Tax=Luteibacter yeojuensis TaxID=345309 RepID=A0A0F3L0G4_9GAMM|nr:hypothetical protein [Luteibacter yeojuensis]KJV36968.1 hypothetical protein VI08_01885 [Luteibacter yeojuensis]
MAKLWEDTIVTVIRDEKWLHALRRGAPITGYPMPQLNMSGNAEQKLGDLVDVTDDRFFLFEVKAEREDIEDEWNTKNAEDGHKKKAFLALHACVYGPKRPSGWNALVDRSLRGHFLAYWAEEYDDDQLNEDDVAEAWMPPHKASWRDLIKARNQVVVTPYILGCLDLWTEEGGEHITERYRNAIRPGFFQAAPEKRYVRLHVPLSLLYEGAGRTFFIDRDAPGETIYAESRWGLELAEMSNYIQQLCARFGSQPEPLHAVIMSSSGRFFRVVTTTAELKDMVTPSPKSAPNATRRVQAEVVAMSRDDKDEWRNRLQEEERRAANLESNIPTRSRRTYGGS